MRYDSTFKIGDRNISINDPTYFIADIAANHDGDLNRAKDLIYKAAEAGAHCAKFQHFLADKIVSANGFSGENSKLSHQSTWSKSVVEIYDQYSANREWNNELVETCKDAEIDFMTTPYDFEAIEMFSDLIPAYKIGSGDITYSSAIEKMAKVGKPVLLATGASDMNEVSIAVDEILKNNPKICLMQCNTNYTGDRENFNYVNLRVLNAFALKWPGMVLGFSDHTPGHSAVVGAVSLGARVIEKHFTDDNTRIGPDHSFALNPNTWRAMVNAILELELALGDGVKRVEKNEKETVIIQRRALRMAQNLSKGTIIEEKHLEALRPCPTGAFNPSEIDQILGRRLAKDKCLGDAVMKEDIN